MPITADDMEDDPSCGDDGSCCDDPGAGDWSDDDEGGSGGDDDYNPAEDEVRCPQCGEPIYFDAEKCDSCGHWIMRADRREWVTRPDSAQSPWLKRIAMLLIALFLLSLLAGLLSAID